MIETNNLTIGYNRKPLVQKINLSVNSGEVLAIIGPNGSGKSTLIKTLLRQLSAINGQVMIDGDNIENLSHRQFSKKVSAVLSSQLRTEYMSGFDVVCQGRYPYEKRIAGCSEADIMAVEGALSFLHIESLGKKDFSKMSDGQKQLIMIARALAQDTPVMILDELENHLDVRYKLEVLSALKELVQKKDKTVIMSLHDIAFARTVADKLLLIDEDHEYRLLEEADALNDEMAKELFSIDSSRLYSGFRDVKIV